MFAIFKYIDYALKAKQGYEAPEELVADTAFAPVEGFFIVSFIILLLLTTGSFFVGFYYSILFFKIVGFILLIILIVDILIFRAIKKMITSLSNKVTRGVKKQINKYNIHEVIDAKDINSTQTRN